MAEMAADLGECGKSSLAKGEWAGDVDLSLAYQRVGSGEEEPEGHRKSREAEPSALFLCPEGSSPRNSQESYMFGPDTPKNSKRRARKSKEDQKKSKGNDFQLPGMPPLAALPGAGVIRKTENS